MTLYVFASRVAECKQMRESMGRGGKRPTGVNILSEIVMLDKCDKMLQSAVLNVS